MIRSLQGIGPKIDENLFDALVSPSVVLDLQGQITAVNAAWTMRARANGLSNGACGVGVDYFAICKSAKGPWHEGAYDVYTGLGDILAARRNAFFFTYPCPNKNQPAWYKLVAGPIQVDRQIVGALVQHTDITRHDITTLKSLTPRETAILSSIVEGLSNKEIARRDGVSESAVKLHLRHIFPKLGVQNRTQAAMVGEHLMIEGTLKPDIQPPAIEDDSSAPAQGDKNDIEAPTKPDDGA